MLLYCDIVCQWAAEVMLYIMRALIVVLSNVFLNWEVAAQAD